MTEKKLREAEKSPLTISFNAKEESLLKKKILSLDSMKKQAVDSMMLDQKILYNQFTLKLRRSDLAFARLVGNRELLKHLTNTMFSSLNTTVNDGAEEAVRAILQSGKPPRAMSAPCRPASRMSIKDMSYTARCDNYHFTTRTRKNDQNAQSRFYSAPTRRKTGNQQIQVKFLDEQKSKNLVIPATPTSWAQKQVDLIPGGAGTDGMTDKPFSRAEGDGLKNNSDFTRQRPKSTSFLMDKRGAQRPGASVVSLEMTADTQDNFDSKIKLFIEKVKSMQCHDCGLRDYYSQRMLDGTGKKEIFVLTSKDEKEQYHWIPVGEEPHHRSVTIKKLDTNFSRRDVPSDILFLEQYNLVLTNENSFVRKWVNNNPYPSTK